MRRFRLLSAPLLCGAALTLLPLAPIRPVRAQTQPLPSPADSVRRLIDTQRPEDAIAYARRVAAERPGDAPALAGLALASLAVEDYGLAVDAAERMLELAPQASAYQLIFGQAYLSHARSAPSLGAIGKVKQGRAAVERAIELDPDNLDARYTLMQFLLQAPGIAGGSRDGARRQADEIARRDRLRGLQARLEIAAAVGRKPELRRVFEDALPALAGLPETSTEPMGAFLGVAGNLDDRELREELTAMVYSVRPDHPVAAYHRARLWVMDGRRLAEAERLLLRYLAGPECRGGSASRAGAHWRLAQLYARLDRKEHAREQYRLAAALDPRLGAGRRIPPKLQARL